MMERFNFSLKEVIYLSVGLILTGVIFTYSVLLAIEFAKSGKDYISAVIGFAGNIIGGIAGGIVAYLVAAYQVRKTFELEGNRSVSASYSLLRLIKSELNNNKKIINGTKNDFSQGNNLSFLNSISLNNWLRCSDRLGVEVSEETIEKTQTCYTKIEAYKTASNNIPLSTSDELLRSIDVSLELINKDIQQMLKN